MERAKEEGRADALLEATAAAATAELVWSLTTRLAPSADDLGLGEDALLSPDERRMVTEYFRRLAARTGR